ncbi:hypothetical protein W04_3365 [Pseudoalteromonas sp. SW0106-04]|nr:hypothetical protein W04_3365 [Pseudoalteromonas sp. SW0106-04]
MDTPHRILANNYLPLKAREYYIQHQEKGALYGPLFISLCL